MRSELVFLFGAGASHGATNVLPCAPPLGTNLYDELSTYSPAVWGRGSRVGRYGNELRKDFEKTLFKEVCMWNPSLDVLEWLRPIALYFSRFSPDSSATDFYSRLLLFLRTKGLLRSSTFGSLNYDTIFEQAAYRLGMEVDYSAAENGEETVRVLKVHGSSNFISGDMERYKMYLTNPNSATGGKINFLCPVRVEEVLRKRFADRQRLYFPVMSLYSFGKNNLIAGNQISEIRNKWQETVSRASLVVIIGVRPNSEDLHIWEPIKNKTEEARNLFYIGSDDHFKSWTSANRNFVHLGKTFEEGFGPLLARLNSSK